MRRELSELGAVPPVPGLAFGVDPFRAELYSLRQARIHEIARDIQDMAAHAESGGRRLSVLEIGVEYGLLKKHLDVWPAARNVDFYGADINRDTANTVRDWAGFWIGDLCDGYPDIPSQSFDVIVCDQVLEHLTTLDKALHTLERLLRPGGILCVGVPIFPHGFHLLRGPLVALADRLHPKPRGHVQTFSHRSFRQLIRTCTTLEILSSRGFRIVSGGILRPLENYRAWWRFNRWLGRRVPGLCIEVQIIARRSTAGASPDRLSAAASWPPGH